MVQVDGRISLKLAVKEPSIEMKPWHQRVNPTTWPITVKISVALCLAALVPMGGIAYYNLNQSLAAMEALEYRNLELLALSTANRLDQLITDASRIAIQISEDYEVGQFLAGTTAPERDVFEKSVQQLLNSALLDNSSYSLAALLNQQGTCLAATSPDLIGQNYSYVKGFKRAIRGQTDISSISIIDTKFPNKPGIYFAVPVRLQNQEIVGVTVLKMKATAVWNIVNNVKVGDQGYAFLLDERGMVISHPKDELMYHSLSELPADVKKQLLQEYQVGMAKVGVARIRSLNEPALARIMEKSKMLGHASYYLYRKKLQTIIGFAPLQVKPWVVGINESKEAFLAPLKKLAQENNLSVVVIGGLTGISALFLGRSIAKPIRCLTKAAQDLEQNTYNAEILLPSAKSQDDIGKFVRTFIRMAEQVKAREERLEAQVRELYIEIDQGKKERQVAEITETEYFQQLLQKAKVLRERSIPNNE
ncbi:cache domain-containing protein [Neosynechococcus sphagnicola]|uniref:cache domain-containing protein n=1 Tax=Neosynechococcus sphagnicola TaxID=1501145 RepID=UPI0006919059|nr:cache domain-containing protein [Neosynechococcus sphagnicola]